MVFEFTTCFVCVLLYWNCAYKLCLEINMVNSFYDFLITKNIEVNKLIWGIIVNKNNHINKLNKNINFYVVKYGVFVFVFSIFTYKFLV